MPTTPATANSFFIATSLDNLDNTELVLRWYRKRPDKPSSRLLGRENCRPYCEAARLTEG